MRSAVLCLKSLVSESLSALRASNSDGGPAKDGPHCPSTVANALTRLGMADSRGNGGETTRGGECLGRLWTEEAELCLLELLPWEACMETGGVPRL